MGKPLLSDIERYLSCNTSCWLESLINLYGVEFHVFKPAPGVFTDVYGQEAGDEYPNCHGPYVGIVVGDDFFPTDANSAGAFQEGWLFVNTCKAESGDLMSIDRDDGKSRRYKIMSKQSLGTTRSVFHKYKLSAVGD